MVTIGTALTPTATKVMLLGSGELGKEITIELQRLGVEVIAVDRYNNAPAQQVAHRSYTISMLDKTQLRNLIEQEKPDYIVPEVEAIATDTLLELEDEGFNIIPTAKATQITMNRERIRKLAAETLGIPTSAYAFVDNITEFKAKVAEIGLPCIVKPIMSSSGRGQSMIKQESDIEPAWLHAQEAGRSGAGRVVIEGFIKFDYEITLLTVRHANGTTFLAPIGHTQANGDYQESWQPQPMSDIVLAKAQDVAKKITNALGGYGIFGVELFISGDNVIFNEVSPRPHDTGLVTLISQDLSEFALHARAILGLPIAPTIKCRPSASKAIVAEGKSDTISFANLDQVLSEEGTHLRLFGKGEIDGHRRLGVVLTHDVTVEAALEKAKQACAKLEILL